MAWLRKAGALVAVASAAAVLLAVAQPEPPEAQANVVCEIGISPGSAVTGAIGIGNPVGDACNAITNPIVGAAEDAALGPIKEAAESVGNSIFQQMTSWVTDGAVWLVGEVVTLINGTTSPNLLSNGFLRQYRQMAGIAAALAAMMLILACLEGLGRGDPGMLWRVFLVNVPVAALATSAAYVVVQLLVATTDGFSEVIAHSTAHDTRDFFKSAIEALSQAGGKVGATAGEATGTGAVNGAAGRVEVPLFVGLIAAILAAVAAFLVWIELLMRAAAIYAVALFLPLSIAASIWPRWQSALRRTAELVVVVVSSKFVIVAIIALAASLAANTGGQIEHVLTAGALLMLACFSPLVLFKLVPFAEGAVGAAFHRQSAGGAAMRTVHNVSSVQMMRRAAQANWGAGGSKSAGRKAGGAGGRSESGAGSGRGNGSSAGARGSGGAKPSGGGKGPSGKGGGAKGASGAGAGAAAASAAGAGVAAVSAGVQAAKGSAKRLADSGTAQASAGGEGAASGGETSAKAPPAAGRQARGADSGRSAAAPAAGGKGEERAAAGGSTSPAASPKEAKGGEPDRAKPPRPEGEPGASGKGGASGKAKR